MFRIVSITIDTMAGIIILVPIIIIIIIIIQKLNKQQVGIFHKIGVITYTCFLTALFVATGIPGVGESTFDISINIIPFIDMRNSPMQYILNVILFIPIGFLLPLVWCEFSELRKTIICGFGLSLFIEIIQLFTFRTTDIDDLITNTLGTIIGYFIAKIIKEMRRKKKESKMLYISKNEPYFISMIVVFVMFFIQPFISDFIWLKILE